MRSHQQIPMMVPGMRVPLAGDADKRGFTIIELLVAITVTLIISGVMIAFTSNLLSVYNRSSGRVTAMTQASLFLDQVTADLESIVLENNADTMLTIEIFPNAPAGRGWVTPRKPVAGSLFVPNPAERPRIDRHRFGQGGAEIRFFTAAPDVLGGGGTGAVRAVNYTMSYRGVVGPGTTPVQYMLFRSEVPADITFENGYNLSDYTGSTLDDPDGGQVDNPLVVPDLDDILVPNVVDLGFRVWARDVNGNQALLFPEDNSDLQYSLAISNVPANQYPLAIEVMVRVLTSEGERLLRAVEDPTIPETATDEEWWGIVEEHSRVFSRLVRFPGRPL